MKKQLVQHDGTRGEECECASFNQTNSIQSSPQPHSSFDFIIGEVKDSKSIYILGLLWILNKSIDMMHFNNQVQRQCLI